MSKRNRSYSTAKVVKDPMHVGTISAEELRKMEQAGRRKQRLILETRPGSGIHGEVDKRSKHRADRRNGKRAVRNWEV